MTYPLAVRALAAHGLPSTALALPRRLEDRSFDELVVEASARRLTGHLVDALCDGTLEASEAQLHAVAERHASEMATALHLEQMLLEVVALLDRSGIEHRCLKGSAVAHLDYPDPSIRCFTDVDLLVRSDQIDAAVATLTGAGLQRQFPQPRPGFDRRFGKCVSFVAPSGHELDLHRTLLLGPFGLLIDLADLWSGSQSFHLAGRRLHALALSERFLHACYTGLGDPMPRLVTLRDIAQIATAQQPSLEVDDVIGVAHRWQGEVVVARAVRLAWELLGLEPNEISRWAADVRVAPTQGRALAVYTDPSARYASRALAATRALSGPRAKAAYLLALAFPRRSYVGTRHRSRVRRWRTAAGQLRRRNRPRRGDRPGRLSS